jgi:hypothetical protein
MLPPVLGAALLAASLSYVESSQGLVDAPRFEAGNTEFEMADLNDDGFLDLISIGDHGNPLIGSQEQGVMTWLGDGRGGWTYRYAGNLGYGGIAVGDLNGDGTADIAYGMHHAYGAADFGDALLEAALGDGTGFGWTPWDDGLVQEGQSWGMFSTDLADVDGDGTLDIGSGGFGASDGMHVYLSDGTGRWRRSSGFIGGNSGNVLAFGEIDGDGVPDIGVSKEEGTAWLGDGDGYYVACDGTLPPVGGWGFREGVSLGDVDGDGHDDLAWCDGSGNAQVWLWRTGQQWISASAGLPADGRCDRTQLHDMDGDGATDLVTLGARTLRVIAGNGVGTAWSVAATVTLPDSPGDPNALRTGGDVDRNGRPDVVVVATQKVDAFNVRNKVRCYRESSVPSTLAVRVVRPGPHRRLLAGSASFVEWASAVPGGVPSRARIEFSAAGSAGPWATIADALPDAGRFQWRVPATICDDCRLRVTITTAGGSASAVGGPFAIARHPDRITLAFTSARTIRVDDALARDRINLYRSDWSRFLATGEYTQDPAVVPAAARSCAIAEAGGSATVGDSFVPAPGAMAFYLATAQRLHEDGQVPGQKVPLAESALGQDAAAAMRRNAHRCP